MNKQIYVKLIYPHIYSNRFHYFDIVFINLFLYIFDLSKIKKIDLIVSFLYVYFQISHVLHWYKSSI